MDDVKQATYAISPTPGLSYEQAQELFPGLGAEQPPVAMLSSLGKELGMLSEQLFSIRSELMYIQCEYLGRPVEEVARNKDEEGATGLLPRLVKQVSAAITLADDVLARAGDIREALQ